MFGTAGLPHILMRFYTVPDAKQARLSVLWATIWIGGFYLITFILGFGAMVLVLFVTAGVLGFFGRPLRCLGCSGGAVKSELFFGDGSVRRAVLVGRHDGQRMAALPCALVARALCEESIPVQGAATAYEFLGARSLLEKLVEAGFELKAHLA